VKTTTFGLCTGLLLAAGSAGFLQRAPAQDKSAWWPTEVEQALGRAGSNRAELVKALDAVPADQRTGMAFLIANMPVADVQSLRADFLLENVGLAYKARQQVPWGRQIPEEIFLNHVLPYANVDEARHPWRRELFALCLPLVKDCKTPAEAAQRLNKTLFQKLQVRYSTDRKKPHQSPKESIAGGTASCTGLSILLSDGCRSVAVPARLVGTPLWANKRGNHTWVEIWDRTWHFTGACEPDARGLDHGWFEQDAAQAQKDSRVHAIYAASFRKTDVTFPLVWAPQRKDVYAENVTERYARPAPAPAPAPAEKSSLSKTQLQQVVQAAQAFFAASETQRALWQFDAKLDALLVDHEAAIRRAVWTAYQAAPIHAALKEDFEQHQVRYQQYRSPYTIKKVGKRPANGWPLFIAMHGGGGVRKEVNDSQWKVMQRYYKDQDTVTGYQYLALRAPNDTWNGLYDTYVPPLIINLIRQFLLFGDVDPAKVYVLGYSHGGYGAFYIGPKIPDRFAAIHSSAAAPTDGAISPKTLRNTRFTYMVGESDNAYGRRQRCEKFQAAVGQLQEADREAFPVTMELKAGYGHGGLPDRDKIKDMYPFTRNAVPRHLSWDLTDAVITHFFWLAVPEPGKGQELDATIRDNTVRITTRNVKQFDLSLDGRLVDWQRPLHLTVDGQSQVVEARPRLLTLCQSLLERGDPELAFACRLRLEGSKK
jgi:transglutaminase-like putative cysteine protease/predicted esterase